MVLGDLEGAGPFIVPLHSSYTQKPCAVRVNPTKSSITKNISWLLAMCLVEIIRQKALYYEVATLMDNTKNKLVKHAVFQIGGVRFFVLTNRIRE